MATGYGFFVLFYTKRLLYVANFAVHANGGFGKAVER